MNRRTIEVINLVSSDSDDETATVAAAYTCSRKRVAPDNDMIVLDCDPSEPLSKRSRTSIPGTCKFEPYGFGEADTDEIWEVAKPSEVEAVVSGGPVAVAVGCADDDDDDEIVVLNASGTTNAMSMPHSREDCNVKPFTRAGHAAHQVSATAANAANRAHCEKCYCFVCEIPASSCLHWSRHCDATYKDIMWKAEKSYAVYKVYHLLSDAERELLKGRMFEIIMFRPGRLNDVSESLRVLHRFDTQQPTIKISIIVLLSMFRLGPAQPYNARCNWGESHHGGPPNRLLQALKLFGRILSSPLCPEKVLRVLATEEDTSSYKEPLARKICPFLFRFCYRVQGLETRQPSEGYVNQFLEVAAECRWVRTATGQPPTQAALSKNAALVLKDIFSTVNPRLTRLTAAIWLFTSVENQIFSLPALLDDLNSPEDAQHLLNVTQSALRADTLTDYALDVKTVQSMRGLFVFFGVLTQLSNHARAVDMMKKVFVALLGKMLRDNEKYVEEFRAPLGDQVRKFAEIQKLLRTSYLHWADIYDRAEGGEFSMEQTVLGLIQLFPVVVDLYGMAVNSEKDLSAPGGVSFQFQRRVQGVRSLLGQFILENSRLYSCSFMSHLLTMKAAVLYDEDGITLRTNVAGHVPHFLAAMKGIHQVAYGVYESAVTVDLVLTPPPILLTLVYFPPQEETGDLFAGPAPPDMDMVSVDNLLDPMDPTTFSASDLSPSVAMKTSQCAGRHGVLMSWGAPWGYETADDFISGVYLKAMLLCKDDAAAHRLCDVLTQLPPDNKFSTLIKKDRNDFQSCVYFARYLFLRVAECIGSFPQPGSSMPAAAACAMIRWARQTCYEIDHHLGRSAWTQYGESSDSSCWAFWSSRIFRRGYGAYPFVCAVFERTAAAVDPLFGLGSEASQRSFFNDLRHIELEDLFPPAVLTSPSLDVALTQGECDNYAHRFKEILSLIMHVKQGESFRPSFLSGFTTLCSDKDLLLLRLFENRPAPPNCIANERLFRTCVDIFAAAAVKSRSVSMMRILLGRERVNLWLRERAAKWDPNRELVTTVLACANISWFGSDALETELRRLMFTSDHGDPSASTCTSPQAGCPPAVVPVRVKCEQSCQWPDLSSSVPSFTFLNMATIPNISRSEVVMMLSILGHFDKVKQMFQSWCGMSRESCRDTFVHPGEVALSKTRSEIDAASMSELILQILLTVGTPKSRQKLLCDLHHWIKWHFLCVRGVTHEANTCCAELITILTDSCEVLLGPTESMELLLGLSYFVKPTLAKFDRYVKSLSSGSASEVLVKYSDFQSYAAQKGDLYRVGPDDVTVLTQGPCDGKECLSDDAAFTAIHYVLRGPDSEKCTDICASFFSFRQLELMAASIKHILFEMTADRFTAIAKSFCRLVSWSSQWLVVPMATMIYEFAMSAIFEALVCPRWVTARPVDFNFIRHTTTSFETMCKLSLPVSQRMVFGEILRSDTDATAQSSVLQYIPRCLWGLTSNVPVGDSENSRTLNIQLLGLICDPTVERFRSVNFSVVPAAQRKNVMQVLPPHLRMSSVALQHDYKALWLAFNEQTSGISPTASPGPVDHKEDMLSKIKDLALCVDNRWFQEEPLSENGLSSPSLVSAFLDDFLFKLITGLNSLNWGLHPETSNEAVTNLFEKLVVSLKINEDVSRALLAMMSLALHLEHSKVCSYMKVSSMEGCQVVGGQKLFTELFVHMQQRNSAKTFGWRANAFSAFIGIDLVLDDLAVDTFYAVPPRCDEVLVDHTGGLERLVLSIERAGFKAAASLEPFVAYLLMSMSYSSGKCDLLENERFGNLISVMSSRFGYLTDIVNEYKGEANIKNILRHSDTMREMLIGKRDRGGIVIPATWLVDVGVKIVLNYLKKPELSFDSKRRAIAMVFEYVCNSSTAPDDLLTRFRQQTPSFDQLAAGFVWSPDAAPLYSKLANVPVVHELILAANDDNFLMHVVSLRALWIHAVDSEDEACRGFVEECFKKATRAIVTNRADSGRKGWYLNFLRMVREDYYISPRMDVRWLEFYRTLTRMMTKPAIKKLIVEVLGASGGMA